MKRDLRFSPRVTKEEKKFLEEQLEAFRSGVTKLPSKPIEKESESFEMKAWDDSGNLMDIEAFCKYHNLPIEHIKKYKLVSHTGSPFYNIEFKPIELDFEGVDFEEVIEEAVKRNVTPLKLYSGAPSEETQVFNKTVYSDVHVGMEPNSHDSSLYGGKWDRDELMSRADAIIDKTLQNQTSDILILEDLGDFADGWNGETTRQGHKLPQNMTNKEVYDIGIDFKIRILDGLCKNFASIQCHNITNDNHSGQFGYIINSGFKKFAEHRYPNVDVFNHEKFIEHYFMGNHCFVITHGKDEKHMKFGFNIHLNDKQIVKIDDYIKHHKIYNQANYIHVCKGDSHQALFDMCSSDDWDYFNYPSLAPSSGWIQGNFSKGRSGFTCEEYAINKNERKATSYWFDWTK